MAEVPYLKGKLDSKEFGFAAWKALRRWSLLRGRKVVSHAKGAGVVH